VAELKAFNHLDVDKIVKSLDEEYDHDCSVKTGPGNLSTRKLIGRHFKRFPVLIDSPTDRKYKS